MNAYCVFRVAIALIGLNLLTGCAKDSRSMVPDVDEGEQNEKLVNSAFRHQTITGARMDRTIYPHHFLDDEAELNSLGRQQIEALTSVATTRPVKVNIMHGNVDDRLYAARVESVRAELAADGVDPERIAVLDQNPGGQGIATSLLVSHFDENAAENMYGYAPRGTGSTDGGKSDNNQNGGSNGGGNSSGGSSGGGSSSGGSRGYKR